jgi:hypothetical protein
LPPASGENPPATDRRKITASVAGNAQASRVESRDGRRNDRARVSARVLKFLRIRLPSSQPETRKTTLPEGFVKDVMTNGAIGFMTDLPLQLANLSLDSINHFIVKD